MTDPPPGGLGQVFAACASLPPGPGIHLDDSHVIPGNLRRSDEVSNAACPRLAPDFAQVCPQDAGAEEIQFTAQADHGHITASVD